MRGLLKAKKEKITVWTSKDLALDKERIGLDGSPTQVVKIFTPESPKRGKILTGEIPEIADKLISEMKKRKII